MKPAKASGRIVSGGMGAFLNPPTHPEHFRHVETDLRRKPENRGMMSLSAAVDAEWLSDAVRSAARVELRQWDPLPLSHPDVQEWIEQVLGYFKGCYRGPGDEPGGWHAGKLVIAPGRDPLANPADHAGVNLIRKYYPDYVPTREDFAGAHWGSKGGK